MRKRRACGHSRRLELRRVIHRSVLRERAAHAEARAATLGAKGHPDVAMLAKEPARVAAYVLRSGRLEEAERVRAAKRAAKPATAAAPAPPPPAERLAHV